MYINTKTGKKYNDKQVERSKCPICYNLEMESNRYKDLETVGNNNSTGFTLWVYYCKKCDTYYVSIY